MPKLDGKRPKGEGPKTGRGQGNCQTWNTKNMRKPFNNNGKQFLGIRNRRQGSK